MTDPAEGWSLEDVLFELHGRSESAVRSVEQRASRRIREMNQSPGTAPRRAVRESLASHAAPLPGDELILRCAPEGQRRIAMLLDQEMLLGHGSDSATPPNYLFPVFLGTTLLERELSRLLAEPIRPLADELAAAQLQHNKKHRIDGLLAWRDGKVPATLGLVTQLILGLRWGLNQDRSALVKHLDERFASPYRSLVANKEFSKTVDQVRVAFRNPACHGERDFFSPDEYRQLARLLTGRDAFRDWRQSPPAESPPSASHAVLHHHLHHLRSTIPREMDARPPQWAVSTHLPDADSLRHRLIHLRPAAPSEWRFEVWVCPRAAVPCQPRAVRAVTRDMGAVPASTRCFSQGQEMCLGFRTLRPGYLALIDLGTSGKFWALCPSNACADSFLPQGESFLPSAGDRWPAFRLSGQPGVERVVAIVTAEPLDLDWRPDELDAPCRSLSASDLTQLLDRLAALPAHSWSVASCEFDLLE
ncbi:MAG: DUF4384 domain-containing protein [Pirellulales bacterium]